MHYHRLKSCSWVTYEIKQRTIYSLTIKHKLFQIKVLFPKFTKKINQLLQREVFTFSNHSSKFIQDVTNQIQLQKEGENIELIFHKPQASININKSNLASFRQAIGKKESNLPFLFPNFILVILLVHLQSICHGFYPLLMTILPHFIFHNSLN